MTPSQKVRHGHEAARNTKWRLTAPPVSSLKHPGGALQPWPVHLHPVEQTHRSHMPPPLPPPPLPVFHTRHAEESADRPHLVTVVQPCGQSELRKISVLLNRRGVVSFEQLLLDISEALGFPRWHRGRVTRLYTTHAREVKGVCDFFHGEAAFLALSKARPELSSVRDALEELFPEHSYYRANALQAWEKKLRPLPNKAAKADSGYSEGTDSSKTNKETRQDTNTNVKHHAKAQASEQTDTRRQENSDAQKLHRKTSCRKHAHIPNNLQKLRVELGVKERRPSFIGQFKNNAGLQDSNVPSLILCENCLAKREKHPKLISTLSGRVPLPPVLKKPKERSHIEPEVKKLDVHRHPSPPPISSDKEKIRPLNPAPDVGAAHTDTQNTHPVALLSDSSNLTLSDVERRYEFGRVIGDGNFAVVRECRRLDNDQTLAMKIVERSKLIGREHMMQNELSLLGSLRHPRIVRLLAHHHTHTHSYLVMELVSGGDLFEAISDRGAFSEAEAGLMVSDVSDALNYIHCKSIVHRDLKPENLLIEKVTPAICRLKLGDFGLAMVVTEPVFTICGTPTYVAPEILRETGYGVAVDIWALGVILYILLCSFAPFRSQDRDQEELFRLIKQAQLHFPSPFWDSISEEAKGLVRSLLQPDPAVRLSAEETLQHQWVKAMTSVCRQRVLTDKTQSNAAGSTAELQRVQTNATESLTDKTAEHSGSKDKIPHSRQDEPKPATLQIQEKSSVSIKSFSDKEQTPSESMCRQGKPEQHEIQDPGPKLPHTDHITSSTAQTVSLSQNKQQSKHSREEQAPSDSPPPSKTHQITTGLLGPAASPTQSLLQRHLKTQPHSSHPPETSH